MAEQTEKTSLKELIQGITNSGAEVLQGIIKSANPLKIQIVNDEKLIIGQSITYVPKHLTDYTVPCFVSKGAKGSVSSTISSGGRLTDFTLTGSITINNSLKAGEHVHVLSFNHGKQYYVLDRVD